MKPKQLTLVVVLALVLGGLGLWIVRKNDAEFKRSGPGLGAKVLPDFPLNDVTAVTFRTDTNALHLLKIDGIWKVRERADYPANFSDLGGFLQKVWDLKAVQVEPVEASQLARLELLEPAEGVTNAGTLVAFAGAEDKLIAQLVLGKQKMRQTESPGSFGNEGWPEGRWVRVLEGKPMAYLVSEPFSQVEVKPDRWLNKDFFKVEKLKRVTVTPAQATNSWTVYRDTEGGELKMADLPEGEEFDTGKASALGNLLSWPSFVDVASPELSPEASGLNDPVVASIETFDGFTYALKLGAQPATNDNHYLQVTVTGDFPKERTAAEGEKDEDQERLDKEFKDRLAKLEEKLKKEQACNGWTYLVSKWTVENFLKSRKDFLKEEPAATEAPAIPEPPSPLEQAAELPVTIQPGPQ